MLYKEQGLLLIFTVFYSFVLLFCFFYSFVFYSLHLFLVFLFACTLVAICQLEFIRIYGYGYGLYTVKLTEYRFAANHNQCFHMLW